ncbi:MAG: helix-turn-helix domain-containing protein [Treponema sp.]|jgi:transcriptional regulator with XRE-family HTH domain|nr:helix-turn-helix domain-containing protein [Treponema sp.]
MTDKEIRELFSKNLKRIREIQGISQLNLANMAGLTHTFINDIENCKKWISPETFSLLCNALRVEPFHFFLSEKNLSDSDKQAVFAYFDEFSSFLDKSVNDFKTEYNLKKPEDEE